MLFFGHDPLDSDYGDLSRHFEVQHLRDQYLRYVEGYRLEYNNRFSTIELSVGDTVLLAKEFNPSFARRRGALESYYIDSIYEILTIHTGFACVKGVGSENEQPFSVHKSLIKKI